MPLPQARHFARADQTTLHARLSEQLRIADRIREAIAEHLTRLLRRGGKLRCLRHGETVLPYLVDAERADARTTRTIRLTKFRPRLRYRRGREM
ncbi:hypothetical protein GCM10010129_49220 [Streptomyces fumigatiscleroticus]|nr:hypothetical protein GCM10010129_49220 [Streptomyces fumigatiscleroticus]